MRKKEFTGFITQENDVQHHFNTRWAKEYGLVEAIILNNIQFWVITNIANRNNFRDGRTWVFNSVRAWCEIFPYLSAKKIRGALDRLVEKKVLVKGCYNKYKYDKTSWYAFEDERLWITEETLSKRKNTKEKSETL